MRLTLFYALKFLINAKSRHRVTKTACEQKSPFVEIRIREKDKMLVTATFIFHLPNEASYVSNLKSHYVHLTDISNSVWSNFQIKTIIHFLRNWQCAAREWFSKNSREALWNGSAGSDFSRRKNKKNSSCFFPHDVLNVYMYMYIHFSCSSISLAPSSRCKMFLTTIIA